MKYRSLVLLVAMILCIGVLFCACKKQSDDLTKVPLQGDNSNITDPDPDPTPNPTPDPEKPAFPTVTVKNAEVYEGDSLDVATLLQIVNEDKLELNIEIDDSRLDLSAIGEYVIIFTVSDAYERSHSYKATVTVKERPNPDDEKPAFPSVTVKNTEVYEGDSLDVATLLQIVNENDLELTIETDDSQLDLSKVGEYVITFTVADSYERSRSYKATVTVKERPDTTPPTVEGHDFEITVGEGISYKKQITVRDDRDPNPKIVIDNSAVDPETPGVYPIVYTVTDSAGNETVLTIYVVVVAKQYDPTTTEGFVYTEAQKILDRITTPDMSKMDVAYAIYRWTKNNIGYWGSTAKGDWIRAAYDTLKNNVGDCYGFFAVSKALLTVAGIDNIDMVKNRLSETATRHYWSIINVGDGWYHFDTTRFRYPEANFFMLTNEEIHGWDAKYYPNSHTYITDGIPEIATKSVQDRVDYDLPELKY